MMNPFMLVEGCRYGRFLVPPADQFVGQALIQYGEYSQLELELLLQFITPDTRVVVVGANLGALVVPLAQHAGEVVAFEPQRWVSQLCAANVVLNGLTNVRVFPIAVGATPGAVTVPNLDARVANNFGAMELERMQEHPGDYVQCLPLDRVPDLACGLLTIDVEGMELDVLRGAEQLIAKCRPVIFFEADRELKKRDLFAWLRDRQYDLYWWRTPLFNPANFKQNAVDTMQHASGAQYVAENVLAVAREQPHQLHNFIPVVDI